MYFLCVSIDVVGDAVVVVAVHVLHGLHARGGQEHHVGQKLRRLMEDFECLKLEKMIALQLS